MTIVCGDSHTATHGAFGALAHGIGTSEVEHVLATQTLIQQKSKNMKVEVSGELGNGVTAKDITLTIIGKTGTAGGTGHVIEYCGNAIESLSMEGRMTVCNMAIEGGARAGLLAPDQKTLDYVKGRPQEVLEATCSADKARKLLNYKTKTRLDKGLSQMIQYIKNKGTKKFRYHLDLEIVNSLTPKTWKDKLF